MLRALSFFPTNPVFQVSDFELKDDEGNEGNSAYRFRLRGGKTLMKDEDPTRYTF